MPAKVSVVINRLASGAANVSYSAGRYNGVVMFDANGRFLDATMNTASSRGRNFVESERDLPVGVYNAARALLKQ